MKQLTTVKKITYLFAFIYFASYVTRINFGAAVLEISSSLQVENTVIGTALTADGIKRNRFNIRLRKINKITNHYA